MPDDDQDEIEEINAENIKKLAQQAAGGGGDEEADEEDEEPELDTSAAAGDGGAGAVQMDVERLKSTIEMLKEQDGSMQDRIQTMSQNIGEIRQMVHAQESTVSEVEADVDLIKDQVEDIAPQEIEKRLGNLKGSIESNKADIQKLEEKLERTEQMANDVQQTLKDLGSLENLIELNKDFEEKINEIKEAQRYIERLAQKSERINIQINKKLNEYNTYKARVDALQEKTSDMFRKLDEIEIQVEDAVEESQLEKMRERIKEMEEQLEEYGEIAPLAEMSLPEPIVELRDQRRDIEEFLDDLEAQHEAGKISTSEYEKIKEANEEKLERINQQLVDEWKRIESAAGEETPAPDEPSGSGEDAAENQGEDGGDASGAEQDAAQEEADVTGAEETDAEDAEAEAEDAEPDEYDELLEQSVEDVKEAAMNQNLDFRTLLERERDGKARDTLLEWLNDKVVEQEE